MRVSLLLVATFFLGGCASSGAFNTAHLTNVQLTEPNYRVVATGVEGEATAAYLLGASVAVGTEMRTLALARVSGNGLLYRAAFDDLWQNFEAAHGPATDRRLALVNVRFDADALNLFLYTRPRVSIRADVVEFD